VNVEVPGAYEMTITFFFTEGAPALTVYIDEVEMFNAKTTREQKKPSLLNHLEESDPKMMEDHLEKVQICRMMLKEYVVFGESSRISVCLEDHLPETISGLMMLRKLY
jgi:hypothetical protein